MARPRWLAGAYRAATTGICDHSSPCATAATPRDSAATANPGASPNPTWATASSTIAAISAARRSHRRASHSAGSVATPATTA